MKNRRKQRKKEGREDVKEDEMKPSLFTWSIGSHIC